MKPRKTDVCCSDLHKALALPQKSNYEGDRLKALNSECVDTALEVFSNGSWINVRIELHRLTEDD